MCVQLWRKYLTNTKISFVENDADCAKKHKAEIEAVAKGKVYVGEPPRLILLHLRGPYKAAPEDLASAWLGVLSYVLAVHVRLPASMQSLQDTPTSVRKLVLGRDARYW